jgi:SpoU rRNA methylase family enzyme
MREKQWKSEVFLSGIDGSKRVARRPKVMKVIVIQDLTEPMEVLKKREIWCIQSVSQPSLLCGDTEVVT